MPYSLGHIRRKPKPTVLAVALNQRAQPGLVDGHLATV